jgi:hypothetical protein
MVTPLSVRSEGPLKVFWRGRQTAHAGPDFSERPLTGVEKAVSAFFAVLAHSGLFFSGAGGSCARGRKIGGPEWAEGSCRKRGKRISITEKTINNRFILKTPS